MNKKLFSEIELYFSRERLQAYAPHRSLKKRIAAYKKNIRLCQKLYVLLHYFEITFRNAIDMALANFAGTSDWMDTVPLDKESLRKIAEVKNVLTKQGKTVTHDRIISELSLGFWTALFSNAYSQYAFQSTIIKNVFQFCPKQQRTIKNLQFCLNDVRRFRNRVCHYERITHYNVHQKQKDILTYIAWISPAVHSMAKKSV